MREWIKMRRFSGVQRHSEPCFCFDSRSLDARLPLQSQQFPANQIQIGQRTGYEQAIGILHQPAVAHLGKSEDALDDQERMLNFGTYPRLRGVLRPLGFR